MMAMASSRTKDMQHSEKAWVPSYTLESRGVNRELSFFWSRSVTSI